MDPISAMATASAAFGAIKKGFAVGRDIEQMAGDLSRWMGALSDLEQAEKEAKNPPIFKKLFSGKTVEQEAMEAFANKRRAQAQRDELKQWITLTLGMKAWDDLIATEGRIRKQRQETIYKQREKRRKFIEIVAWTTMISIGLILLYLFIMFLKGQSANADTPTYPEYVTCRLVVCEKTDNGRICVYRGANNTTENMFFEGNNYPREYQCKYDPQHTKPPTLKETLEAIREAISD